LSTAWFVNAALDRWAAGVAEELRKRREVRSEVGKYDKVNVGLTKLVPVEDPDKPGFRAKVDEQKAELRAGKPTPDQLALAYRVLRLERDELDAELKKNNVELTAVCEVMEDAFESRGIDSIKLKGDGSDSYTIGMQQEPYAKVEDREKFHGFIVVEGLQGQMTFPWATTNAMTKERLLNGEPEPPGVKAYLKTTWVMRKGR
jgi:hypothetical protein